MTQKPSTSRVRLKPKAPAAAAYVALASMTLAGVAYSPGKPIPAKVLAGLSEKVRQGLINTDRLGLADSLPTFTPAEIKAQQAVDRAATKLKEAHEFLSKTRGRKATLEKALADFALGREALSLAAERGDPSAQKKLESTRAQFTAQQAELRDVGLAEQAAVKELASLEVELRKATDTRAAAEAERILTAHCELSERLETEIKRLAPMVEQYRRRQRQIAALTGDSTRQLYSEWRLTACLGMRLGLETPVPPSHRFESLREVEENVLRGVVKAWRSRREVK